MLGQKLNELTIRLALQPLSPVLVKAGEMARVAEERARLEELSFLKMYAYYEEARKREEREIREARKRRVRERRETPKEEADMPFVRTRRNGREEPYLPGSSLKGVLRNRAEVLARTLSPNLDGACDPFASSCAKRWDDAIKRPRGATVYAEVCPICKVFGHPYLAGRLSVSDAFLAGGQIIPDRLPRRNGVGIDRFRGAASEGAKYDYELWDRGPFICSLVLRNFELWQLGLIAYLLYELEEGRIRFGYGTRRGLGRLKGSVETLRITYFGDLARYGGNDQLRLVGLGQLPPRDKRWEEYEFWPNPPEPPTISGVRGERDGLHYTWYFGPKQREALWDSVAPLWNEYISQYGQ